MLKVLCQNMVPQGAKLGPNKAKISNEMNNNQFLSKC